jgi:hypothetical protein
MERGIGEWRDRRYKMDTNGHGSLVCEAKKFCGVEVLTDYEEEFGGREEGSIFLKGIL